ncbi:MAG: histidine--tRNA ligase [Candidatus Marinimicrobia bacterium]|nr:histidine--tRNA ligase [Candidatus Neomarinimicrobiota bacterium]
MKYRRVRGTKDILPQDSYKWLYIEDKIKNFANIHNYKYIKTPAFEVTDLFIRSIGDDTDIVSKEMYTFKDKGNNSLTLKPEMTAPVIRAYIEERLNQLASVIKLYYIDSLFRQERPQKGRLRQFHQYGFEIIGSSYPEADAEIIFLSYQLLRRFGIENMTVKVNSIGDRESRKKYLSILRESLEPQKKKLCKTCQIRFERNILRLFDCKEQSCQAILDEHAPRIIDYISKDDREHFDEVLRFIEKAGVECVIDHKLVRGLDYYTRTTFEITSNLLGAQDALCGGGRYDHLVEDLGGQPTPAVGVAGGIERLWIALEEIGKFPTDNKDFVYIASVGDDVKDFVINLIRELSENSISYEVDLLRRSLKAQMRDANKKGARFSIIVGNEELKKNMVVLKDMQEGIQELISVDSLIKILKEKLTT